MSLLEKPENRSQVTIHNQIFADIDQFSAVLNQKRYFRLTQLQKAPFQYQVNCLDFGLAQFLKFQSNCSIEAKGEKSEGYIEFVCLFNDNQKSPYISHGIPMTSQYLFAFDHNREADSIVPANTELVLFRIDKNCFFDCIFALDRPDINDRLFNKNYLFLPETIVNIKRYIKRIFNIVEKTPHILHQPLLEKLILENFTPLLINSIPCPPTQKNLPLSPNFRKKIFQEARDFMIAHLDKPITIKDICLALHAGSSTISYSFQDTIGLSPMKYLKILRLNKVYQTLRIADPQQISIAQIANSCGFWSLGHFSRDYKQFFGELPSLTLNKRS